MYVELRVPSSFNKLSYKGIRLLLLMDDKAFFMILSGLIVIIGVGSIHMYLFLLFNKL